MGLYPDHPDVYSALAHRWAALSLICWENIIGRLFIIPWQMIKKSFLKPVKIITNSSLKGVKKKKSYKEIRPRSIGVVLDNSYYTEDKSNKNTAQNLRPNDNVGHAQTIAAKPGA